MHILFLTDNFYPEVNAPATRTYEHVMEWGRKGVKVTVVTGFPNFPAGKVFAGYKNRPYKREQLSENVSVVRVWTYIAPNSGFIRRVSDYLTFAFSSFIAGLFIKKVDVIVATSPQFFTTWSGYALSHLKKVPWVFELRDLWPESIVTVGAMKRGKLVNTLEKIELYLYGKADIVISVTNSFVDNLAGRGILRSKIKVVTNGVNREQFKPEPRDEALVEHFDLDSKIIVGYIGTMGMAHGLDFILKSIAKMENRDKYMFLFIGDGAEKDNLVMLKETLNLDNVIFTGMVSKNKVRKYISLLDIALVNLRKRDTFKHVIPSKVFELSAMEKPILLGVDGEIREMVESYDSGLFFEPEDEKDFIEKLEMLDPAGETYKRIRLNTLAFAKAYDRKLLAGQMLEIIEAL